MNTRVRQPPPTEDRALERFFEELYRLMSRVGSVTTDLGSIAAGTVATFTISVPGARANMTVQLGPPAGLEANLIWGGLVSADDVVTVRVLNPTGAPIDPASGVWNVRVME